VGRPSYIINASKQKMKLKGRQLKEMQDRIAVVNYAIDKAMTDHFLRQDVFELLDSARECGLEIERVLTP
jgi:hypothetical protein